MAYRNLIAVSTANRAEVFKRFRDFVCRRNGSYDYSTTGIGWTLHDAVYAVDQNTISTNDYFVIYSPGESGNEDLYFKVSYIANTILIVGFLYWNNSTHVGVQQYNVTNNWNIADAAVPILWIYGDLDSIVGIARESSASANFYSGTFGKAITVYNSETATCSGALSSGTDIVIDVGTVPSHWFVGQRLFIRDTVNIARITISAKTSSTITATLATSYLAGSKLSADLGYYVTGGSQLSSANYVLIAHDGTKSIGCGAWTHQGEAHSSLNPDAMNQEHMVQPYMSAAATYGILGTLRNVYKRAFTGLTALSVYADADGVSYRAFSLYGSAPIIVKEV